MYVRASSVAGLCMSEQSGAYAYQSSERGGAYTCQSGECMSEQRAGRGLCMSEQRVHVRTERRVHVRTASACQNSERGGLMHVRTASVCQNSEFVSEQRVSTTHKRAGRFTLYYSDNIIGIYLRIGTLRPSSQHLYKSPQNNY
jgi:hypothetical protein